MSVKPRNAYAWLLRSNNEWVFYFEKFNSHENKSISYESNSKLAIDFLLTTHWLVNIKLSKTVQDKIQRPIQQDHVISHLQNAKSKTLFIFLLNSVRQGKFKKATNKIGKDKEKRQHSFTLKGLLIMQFCKPVRNNWIFFI